MVRNKRADLLEIGKMVREEGGARVGRRIKRIKSYQNMQFPKMNVTIIYYKHEVIKNKEDI